MRRLLPAGVPDEFRYPRTTVPRVATSLFNIVMGLRLLGIDDILGTNPGYRLMDAWFINDAWFGLGLLLFGLVMGASLYTDVWLRPAIVASLVALITWGLVAIAILKASPSSLGSVVYTFCAVLHACAFFHIAAWQQQIRRGLS